MSDTEAPPLQTVVQINLYREQEGQFEYLLLKRIDADPNFWQVVTEPVPSYSTIAETVRQAAMEQVGLRGFKRLNRDMYSYEWYAKGERGRDVVFAAELRPETVITIDHSRYDDYAWLPIEEAAARVKWNGNRTALKQLHERLLAEQAANQQPHNPYGPNVPKRLPDQPEPPVIGDPNSPSPNPNLYPNNPDYPRQKPINPGELFL